MTAIDMVIPGFDFDLGAGLVDALAAVVCVRGTEKKCPFRFLADLFLFILSLFGF